MYIIENLVFSSEFDSVNYCANLKIAKRLRCFSFF